MKCSSFLQKSSPLSQGKSIQQGRNDRAWLQRRASSILNKSGLWNPDAIEAQPAHVEGNAVRRAYARAEFWDERVKMMQWWADQLDQLKQCGEVIDALNPNLTGSSGLSGAVYFVAGRHEAHSGDLESLKLALLAPQRDIFAFCEAMGLQMNSLLFWGLSVIFDSPRRAVSAAGAVQKHATALAFVSPETPHVTLRPNLSPFPGIQMARGVDWGDDLVTSVGAALREF
jgi:hypothetical protein